MWTLALHSGRMVAVKFGEFSLPTYVNVCFHHICLHCKRRFRGKPTFIPKFNSNLRRNDTYRFKERSRMTKYFDFQNLFPLSVIGGGVGREG